MNLTRDALIIAMILDLLSLMKSIATMWQLSFYGLLAPNASFLGRLYGTKAGPYRHFSSAGSCYAVLYNSRPWREALRPSRGWDY